MKGDIQFVKGTTYDAKGYLDENSFAQAQQTKPDTINSVMTHLGGKMSDKFPLTYLTEGQAGGSDYKEEIQDAQFMWDVVERPKKIDSVVSHSYSTGQKPGIGGAEFNVIFATRHLIEQTIIVSRDETKCRIARTPIKTANGWLYSLVIASGNPLDYCNIDQLITGSSWGMISPGVVSESDSMGNRSNDHFPGKMKNQLTFMRSSYRYGGNVANTHVLVSYLMGDKKTTTLHLEYKDYEHEMLWRENVEEMMLESVYNRRADGTISLLDENSGKPVPLGAGVLDQIPHTEGYGELTYKKLNDVIGDVAYGATDTDRMQILLMGGTGFLRDFDTAVKTEALGLSQVTGDKFISGAGRNLALTGFFKQFDHVDGHTVIVSHHRVLDFGGRAQVAEKHHSSGFPITSHEAIFLDTTNYDGQRNLQMVCQKGRSFLKGTVPGMSPELGGNGSFGFKDVGGRGKLIATEQDTNSVHFFGSKSININRNEHCLRFLFEAA